MLMYIVFCILFQLLVEINCQMTPFKPKQRYLHTATQINNKLYILGGENLAKGFIDKEFFYLDVSGPFNTKELSWQDLSGINVVPNHFSAASVKGGANNNTLFLYGGFPADETMALVYTFDPQSNSWNIPKITGVETIRKNVLTGVIDDEGKMYLWSGGGVIYGNSTEYKINYAMLILDTVNLSWGEGNLSNAPPRISYGAVLLPNNQIIYMGGYATVELALDQVYIYDTISNNWSTKATSGKLPTPRDAFSAVLGLDGQRIIIFGGDESLAMRNLAPENSLYVLNLLNFEWYIPKISGNIPTSRMFHQANVIGKYMVISYGFGYFQSTESDILLLDISNNDEYIWTYDFVPSSSATSTTSAAEPTSTFQPSLATQEANTYKSKSSSSKLVIIGAIAGILFGTLFSVGGFFLYKRNKNKRKQRNVISTPGTYNYYDQAADRNIYNHRQETNESTTNHRPVIPPSVINNNYNHRQGGIPITNNERFSLQNINSIKDELKQEIIQDLRKEMLQNNGQASVYKK